MCIYNTFCMFTLQNLVNFLPYARMCLHIPKFPGKSPPSFPTYYSINVDYSSIVLQATVHWSEDQWAIEAMGCPSELEDQWTSMTVHRAVIINLTAQLNVFYRRTQLPYDFPLLWKDCGSTSFCTIELLLVVRNLHSMCAAPFVMSLSLATCQSLTGSDEYWKYHTDIL